MKVFGHPIHIMLVHFPTALLPMELVFSAINYFYTDSSFLYASFYAMSAGVILGWAAIVFGAFDLISIYEHKPEVMSKALVHGGVNTAVICVYTVLAYMQYKNYPSPEPDGLLLLIIKALTNAFLILGNFFGGDLILKYKVAIKNE